MPHPKTDRLVVDVHIGDNATLLSLPRDVRVGLTSDPKWLPPKYFYDHAGSLLFEQITELPEYYPTRSERSILETAGEELLKNLEPVEILELGSGSSSKTRVLLRFPAAKRSLRTYIPFDVSERMMRQTAAALLVEFPYLRIHGIVGDFERDMPLIPEPKGRRLVLFLGGTIGNLHPEERAVFLSTMRHAMGDDGHALIGMDVVKPSAIIQRAYDDAAGVTADFNLNVLRVINRELGADFDLRKFEHVALFNDEASRIEMHLEAKTSHHVVIDKLKERINIEAGERIWTEASYKFTQSSAEAAFAVADLRLERWITSEDPTTRFALALVAPN